MFNITDKIKRNFASFAARMLCRSYRDDILKRAITMAIRKEIEEGCLQSLRREIGDVVISLSTEGVERFQKSTVDILMQEAEEIRETSKRISRDELISKLVQKWGYLTKAFMADQSRRLDEAALTYKVGLQASSNGQECSAESS